MRADDRPEKLPNFLAQETGGMHEYLNLLFRLYSYQGGGGGDDGGRSADGAVVEWDRHELAEERIRSLCELLVAEFVKKETVVSSQALMTAAPFSSSSARMFRLSAGDGLYSHRHAHFPGCAGGGAVHGPDSSLVPDWGT